MAEKHDDDKRSPGRSVAAIEASDPIETDPVEEQATVEAPAGGTSPEEEVPSVEDKPTGGQSFDYGRRPWEEG